MAGRRLARNNTGEVRTLLEDMRHEFRYLMMHETALTADCLLPEARQTARAILGIGDVAKPKIEFDDDARKHIRTMRMVLDGNKRAIDAMATEIFKNGGEEDEDVKTNVAKLVNAKSILLLKTHVSNPERGPKEQELLDALENLDSSVIGPMRKDIESIVRKTPYESVKRAAMAVLERNHE
ncbi:MAG TPA: hypothetical protein VLD37_04135 [Candidatus Bilamarchaeum sp.]|nr:hypothetical protein [Candidatus Bilamarchaeum sp.]